MRRAIVLLYQIDSSRLDRGSKQTARCAVVGWTACMFWTWNDHRAPIAGAPSVRQCEAPTYLPLSTSATFITDKKSHVPSVIRRLVSTIQLCGDLDIWGLFFVFVFSFFLLFYRGALRYLLFGYNRFIRSSFVLYRFDWESGWNLKSFEAKHSKYKRCHLTSVYENTCLIPYCTFRNRGTIHLSVGDAFGSKWPTVNAPNSLTRPIISSLIHSHIHNLLLMGDERWVDLLITLLNEWAIWRLQ